MRRARSRDPEKLPELILRELSAIALARATDCLQLTQGQVMLKEESQMRPEDAAAIASVEKTAAGCKVKFYDKLKALELLGSHLGMFGGTPPAPAADNRLLEAVLEATARELPCDDLPELL